MSAVITKMAAIKNQSNKIMPVQKISITEEMKISYPGSLNATSGDTEGEIDLIWEPVKGADTYLIQKSSDPKNPLKWIHEDIVAKSSYTVTKLRSRHKYWFRVAAVGRKGQGPWSEPVQKKAP
jgi:hypothetical protein